MKYPEMVINIEEEATQTALVIPDGAYAVARAKIIGMIQKNTIDTPNQYHRLLISHCLAAATATTSTPDNINIYRKKFIELRSNSINKTKLHYNYSLFVCGGQFNALVFL